MVVEPPGDLGRGRVFEVDDGILVAGELALVKKHAGAVHQALILIAGPRRDTLTVEAREERGRAGSIKAFIVIKDANPQKCILPQHSKKVESPELLSIKGPARCVKPG